VSVLVLRRSVGALIVGARVASVGGRWSVVGCRLWRRGSSCRLLASLAALRSDSRPSLLSATALMTRRHDLGRSATRPSCSRVSTAASHGPSSTWSSRRRTSSTTRATTHGWSSSATNRRATATGRRGSSPRHNARRGSSTAKERGHTGFEVEGRDDGLTREPADPRDVVATRSGLPFALEVFSLSVQGSRGKRAIRVDVVGSR
jgi:hypothetical protein